MKKLRREWDAEESAHQVMRTLNTRRQWNLAEGTNIKHIVERASRQQWRGSNGELLERMDHEMEKEEIRN